jgi:hypothetical protein
MNASGAALADRGWKRAFDDPIPQCASAMLPPHQKIETAQRRQRSNIFGLGPVLHNKLAVDA